MGLVFVQSLVDLYSNLLFEVASHLHCYLSPLNYCLISFNKRIILCFFFSFFIEALSRLDAVIRHPNALHADNVMAYDNAVSALGKICQFHRDSIDAAQVLYHCTISLLCVLLNFIKIIIFLNLCLHL